MLYYPWRTEEEEIAVKNINQIYSRDDVQSVLNFNKRKFENVNAQRFDEAVNLIEREIEEGSDNEVASAEADRIGEASKILQLAEEDFGNLKEKLQSDSFNKDRFDVDLIESYIDDIGYQAPYFSDDKCPVLVNEINQDMQMPEKIPLKDLVAIVRSLNEEQHILLVNVINKIFNKEQFSLFLSGAGGSGKSHFIKAVYQIIMKMSKKIDKIEPFFPTIIAAFTGQASFNVSGNTIHTLFGIPVRIKGKMLPLTSVILLRKRKSIRPDVTRFLIVDEISTVGCNLWSKVNQRLQELMGNTENFGGRSVIVVGDFNQLKPVMEESIYTEPYNIFRNKTSPYQAFFANSWNQFKIYEFTEIMRQSEDIDFINILRLIGNYGIDFCSENQIKKLDERIVSDLTHIPLNAIILTWTNASVRKLNIKRIDQKQGEVFICYSANVATGPERFNTVAINKKNHFNDIIWNEDEKRKLEDTNNLPWKILLKVGCRYMLTFNINTFDGLCNGSVGVLKFVKRENDFAESMFEGKILISSY